MAPLPPGTTFGEFRIVRPLAEGGMGAVYVAEQLSTGKQRALKVMHGGLMQDARLRERFEQEARVAARIDSEHVVEVVGAGVDVPTGTPWLAMELLEGADLGGVIAHRGPLPADEVRDLMGQLCHALAAAHRVGVVHRDLKPENVFVSRPRQQNVRSKVKVLDFGIAKVVAEARATSSQTASMGTPRWMAPEQTDGRGVISPATDVWALGLIAFTLLTGRWYWTQASPETGGSVMTLMREVLFEPIVPPSLRAAQYGRPQLVPHGFDAWFARCVARDIGSRYPDAGQAMAALDGVLAGAGLPTAPVGPAMWAPAPAYTPMGQPAMTTGREVGGMGHTLPEAPVPRRGAPVGLLLGLGLLIVLLGGLAVGGFLWAQSGGGHASGAGGPNVAGSYAITASQNIGGGSYAGSVLLMRSGEAHRMSWTLAKGPGYEGLALVTDRTLAVGWATGGRYGVAAYKIEGGKLHGRWTNTDAPSTVGFEELSGPESLSGTYTVVKATGGYTGTVSIVPTGETYAFTWSLNTGSFRGIGIKRGDVLSVGWSPSGMVGVVSYEISRDALIGRWSTLNETRTGSETLTRR